MWIKSWTTATVWVLSCGLLAGAAQAKELASTAQEPRILYSPARGVERGAERDLLAKAVPNLIFHGGSTLHTPTVVFLFWGPTFANAVSPDHAYAVALQNYRNGFGATPQWADLREYGIPAPVALNAGTPDWFDVRVPPVNVTDAIVQGEVHAYLALHPVNFNSIYEVVLPGTSYSSSGGATSCGGPNVAYCAYHSWIGNDPTAIKYSIQPYPSCAGCQIAGWTPPQNQELFVCHQTRETVTDPTGNGWWDNTGQEADDKCAWAPPPYLVGGFGYQFEWSNARGRCIP